MTALIEKTFFFSLFLYGFALPISISLANIALAFLLVSSLIIILRKKTTVEIPASFYILGCFFLWAALTTFFSRTGFKVTDLKTFQKLWNYFPYLIIPLVWRETEVSISSHKILRVTALTGSLVIILGLMEYLFGIGFFFTGWFGFEKFFHEQRFYGFQSHPLHTGGLYTVLFLTSLSIALFCRSYPSGTVLDQEQEWLQSKEKYFWSCFSVFLGCGVLLTGSRAYYLGMTMGFLILLSIKGLKTLWKGALLAVFILIPLTIFNPYIAHRIKSILPSSTDESGRQRIYIWKSSLLMIQENPFAGVGYKRWKDNLESTAKRFPDWKMDRHAYAHAHNSYLTVAAETGIIGLALFLFFWAWLLKEQFFVYFSAGRGTLSSALTCGTIVSIFSLLLAAFFEHNLLTAINTLALFFLIGVSRALKIQIQ